MRRYLYLLYIFYKAAILTDLEYRANFVVHLVLSAVAALWSIAGVLIIYQHTDQVGDWSFAELLVILGLFMFFMGLVEAVLYPNVQTLMDHIRLGTMDFILTKPLNAQFHATLRRINFWRLPDVAVGLTVIIYALSLQEAAVPAGRLLLLFLLCMCALVILYSLVILLVSSAFWFVQLDNVMELLFTFFEAGRFPVTVFPAWVRVLLTFVIPIAFVTTVPAAIVLGRQTPAYGLWAVLFAAITFVVSSLFWRYAVRHYSSASS